MGDARFELKIFRSNRPRYQYSKLSHQKI